MLVRRIASSVAVVTAAAAYAPSSRAQHPDGAAVVRLLGVHARDAFAPAGAPAMGGLVRLPSGTRAADVGLREVAPGFARIWGTPATIVSFADVHPALRVEVSPPLHLLLDTAAGYVGATVANVAGHEGKNVLVGIADTGIDVTHPSFRDANGTRVQWLLDLSSPPIGKYPDLEKKYGSTDTNGNLIAGAVWAKTDIDALLAASSQSALPRDDQGHGTLVASCAAGEDPRYRGVAPQAGLLIARVTGVASDSIGNDELLRGVAFLFDRADSMKEPVAVNLSIGSDFGPHDGSLDWEQALAGYVGPAQPGHALVVAAGNSGSIAQAPVHQNVHVTYGLTTRVALTTRTAQPSNIVQSGGVQVWIAMHPGADLRVGLDSPTESWIAPVRNDDSAGKNTASFAAAVYNGGKPSGSPVPQQSHGAIVVWQGKWPAGTYYVTLAGLGTADLYVQGTGELSGTGVVGFADGVRESTISLPATHPAIIGVGCTINKKAWQSVSGQAFHLHVPLLDVAGGEVLFNAYRDPVFGEPCWFSSAGPTVTGVMKPEIMAPGGAIVGALSQQAIPPSPRSVFGECPVEDPKCEEIDELHAVSAGTSFSAPLVTGAVAILFEHDPTLTQDGVVAALQGGAHRLRGAAPFSDQAGAGELDVAGALAAVDRSRDPQLALPVRTESWMTLAADEYLADGSTPLEVVVELRTARSGMAAPGAADGFDPQRFAAYTLVDGSFHGLQAARRVGPGVWLATVQLPAGLGGSRLTVGARFDGADIVEPKSVPIATDVWNAQYPPTAKGGCAVAGDDEKRGRDALAMGLALVVALARRRSRMAPARSRLLADHCRSSAKNLACKAPRW
jgi:MYXO-CTERM domain-containing protein